MTARTHDVRDRVFDAGLDLRQLGVLRAISETGSLAAAGRALDVSQPTIAHHLSALEQTLTTVLVRRGPRGAVLTDIGRVFVDQADVILDRVASAVQEARTMATWGIPTLRIGTFSSAGGVLLPAAVADVQRHMNVPVELHEAETVELLADLAQGALNIALVYNDGTEPLPIPDGWRADSLLWDPYLLAMPHDHPGGSQGVADLADFAEDGWILSQQSDLMTDRSLLLATAVHGFSPRPVLRTDDFHVALGFVSTGFAVTMVPRLAAEPRAGVRYCPTGDPQLGRTIGVVYPVAPVPVVAALVDRLHEQAAAVGNG